MRHCCFAYYYRICIDDRPINIFRNGFESEIFSARRIKLAPVVCLAGFVLMIVGILYPTKEYKSEKEK